MEWVYVVTYYSEDGNYGVYGIYFTHERAMQAIEEGREEDRQFEVEEFWMYTWERALLHRN